MPKKILIILFLLLSNLLFAQEWTEPINISNMDGIDYYPDITVGLDGTLHCVWTHNFSNQHMEIFYSNSNDEGLTWSTPISISNNDTLVCLMPQIVADSNDNLYVTYEYNALVSSIVVIQKFDGEKWSEIDSIAEGYSYNNRICIDKEDRIYVFWYQGSDKIFYKYFENEAWSEVIIPYDTDDFNILYKAVIDQNNNVHVIGNYQDYISYFKYNKLLDQWDNPVILSDNIHLYEGSDISVDNNNDPQIVWRERTTDIYPYNDGTLYGYYNGSTWSMPEMIVEDPTNQKIVCFKGKPYIMDMEKEPNDSVSAVLYQQDDYGNWFGIKTLKTSYWIALIDFGIINNRYYNLFYWRADDVQYDIFFRKTKYALSVNEVENKESPIFLEQNFPNPFTDNTIISYTLNHTGHCTLTIHNLEGKLVQTLISEKQTPGTYSIEWNGRNSNGEKLPAGIYLYRLSLDNYRMTKSLILN